jgi:hypothetical protein
MTLVAASVSVAVHRVLCVPPVTRVITGSTQAAVHFDPVVDAIPILPVRLPPTALQIADKHYDCDERAKQGNAGKGDCQILSDTHSKHSAVSKEVASDV